jgi:hypothetical protein
VARATGVSTPPAGDSEAAMRAEDAIGALVAQASQARDDAERTRSLARLKRARDRCEELAASAAAIIEWAGVADDSAWRRLCDAERVVYCAAAATACLYRTALRRDADRRVAIDHAPLDERHPTVRGLDGAARETSARRQGGRPCASSSAASRADP